MSEIQWSPRTSIVIATLGRDAVLIRTVRGLLNLVSSALEIIVVDQTVAHSRQTTEILDGLNAEGLIRWVNRPKPSITESMNFGMRMAKGKYVLFVDDDVVPVCDLVRQHQTVLECDGGLWATVGQVIQPWQVSEAIVPQRRMSGLRADDDFPLNTTFGCPIENAIGCNLCVHRERALSIGGFDENFQGSAYRFETEFARRIQKADGRIQFVGSAGIKHLRVPSGGTRSKGSHLTSPSPRHGIGDHYYAFLHGRPLEAWKYSIRRVFREVCTKFHATHPWWIPVKLVGELRAMWGGWRMAAAKRREGRGARGEESQETQDAV